MYAAMALLAITMIVNTIGLYIMNLSARRFEGKK